MTITRIISCLLGAALPLAVPFAATANPYADNLSVRLIPGWEQRDGSHIAGLELRLKDGWKTYWRAPGDAGVPPIFSWQGSENVGRVTVMWPKPQVFWQNGMRSIGYSDQVILPLRVDPSHEGAVHLDGELQVGICSDICVPLLVDLSQLTLPEGGRRDPGIAAALAERPFSAQEAGVRSVACQITPKGRKIGLRAEIDIPPVGGEEVVVVETRDPNLWVSEAETQRMGDRLVAEVNMTPITGQALMVNRSDVTLTVLGQRTAVEIEGCSLR